jgi:GH43 family beta-xylosidase
VKWVQRPWCVGVLALACERSGERARDDDDSTSSADDDDDGPGGDDDDDGPTSAATDGADTGDDGSTDDAPPQSCAETTCSDRGVCVDGEAGPVCTCDEGFVGDECETQGDDYHRRTLLVPGLADPDVLAEHDDLFFLVGTGSTVTVPIFESTDLAVFTEVLQYDPSAIDPVHDYCYVWAPDLTKHDGVYDLYFSAHRVAKGAACPPAGQDVTTFHVSAPSTDFAFGVPELLNDGTALPHSRIDSGCPSQGCDHAIRIDAAVYDDGVERWFSYVFFQGGNNIATFRFSDPATLVRNAGPAVFATAPYEESINEGPDFFRRDGRHYMFFSAGFFDSQYAMYYVIADDVAGLTRARNVRRHSEALRSADGDLVESHGHNSIVQRRGEWFNVFHMGEFDGAGDLTGRSTHKQRIAFRDDGSIVALSFVDLRWSRIPGAQYSVDLVTKDGTVVGPCIAVGRIGTATTTRYRGICPDGGDVRVEKSEVAAFRVYHSTDGTWTQFTDVAYDGGADRLFVAIDGGTTDAVELHWNELATAAEYSLDVQRADGSWIAPCVGAPTLGRSISHVYTGACTSTPDSLPAADVKAFRVCSAENGNWAVATCGATDHDGTSAFVDVAIP